MADKFVYVKASPEQIQKCLNCTRPYCNDCRPMKRKTQIDREAVYTLWKNGCEVKDIAAALGCSKNAVYKVLTMLNISFREKRK